MDKVLASSLDDGDRTRIEDEIIEIITSFQDNQPLAVLALAFLVEREFNLGVSVGKGLEQSARGDTIPIPTDWHTYPNDGVSE